MRIFTAILILLMLATTVSAELTVNRSLPDSASPGEEITVTLSIKIDGEKPAGAIIEESIPDGFTYVSSHPEATETNGKLKWVLYGSDLKDMELEYTLKVAEGNANFEGTYTTLLGTETIGGDTTLKVTAKGEKTGTAGGIPGFELLIAATSILMALVVRKYM